jgi:exopolyphosphatase / guanosine-5'-triphosphate,3'-diphosphate pyrophosphatase
LDTAFIYQWQSCAACLFASCGRLAVVWTGFLASGHDLFFPVNEALWHTPKNGQKGEERMLAAVDLGSNSFRLHVGQQEQNGMRVVKSARDPIRLAAGLDEHGFLSEAAMQAALESLRRFAAILGTYQLDAVRAVATNTLRVAKNAEAFLPLAEKALGYPIDIISGEEEGRLIYLGVASSVAIPTERRLVLDIGGGSTELILGQGTAVERVESFGIGTVRQSLSFFADGRIDAASFDAAILSARSQFEDAAELFAPAQWSQVYGSSGTMRAIGDAIAKNGIGNGNLNYQNLAQLKTRLIGYGRIDAVALAGIKPERVTVLVGGVAILIGLMQELGIEALEPIEAGLRLGVLWDLQLRATPRDRREQSVQDFLQRFGVDQSRASHVANSCGTLYRILKPAADTYQKLLYWSALLHESGLAISQNAYHKHSAYLIEHADIAGFTTREQRTMSQLALGQKGNLRKLGAALSEPDFAKAVLALRLAVIFLHARIALEQAVVQLKMKNRIELEIRKDWIAHHPTLSYWLQKEQECWDEVDVDFALRIN